jgi:hypothetical protein
VYESAKAGAIVTALIAKAAIAAIVFVYMGVRLHPRDDFETCVFGNVIEFSRVFYEVLTRPECELFRTYVNAERPWKRLCSQVNPYAR